MKLKTNRLILKEYNEKDILSLIKNINNINIAKNVSSIPHPYTKHDATWWINNCKEKSRKTPRESYEFGIRLKTNTDVIGGIGCFGIDYQNKIGELGCWLGEYYWKKGIMSEAAKKLIDFSFKNLKLKKLVWKAYTNNKASNILAKKLGFELKNTLKNKAKCLATGKIHDYNLYELIKIKI